MKKIKTKGLQPSDDVFMTEVDRFFFEFDQQYPEKSISQQRKIEEFKRIDNLRDNPSKNQ